MMAPMVHDVPGSRHTIQAPYRHTIQVPAPCLFYLGEVMYTRQCLHSAKMLKSHTQWCHPTEHDLIQANGE